MSEEFSTEERRVIGCFLALLVVILLVVMAGVLGLVVLLWRVAL